MPSFTVKIDQLPPEVVEAVGPREAAREVLAMLTRHEALRRLATDEPVEIKRPDGRPWGRNLTIADFKAGVHEVDDVLAAGDGPVRPAAP